VAENQTTQTDQELVVAALKDRHAFASLVQRYESPMARYIVRLGCHDPELAKDILQESFIKAYVNLNDYDPSLSFSAWLYRIVHNETINHFRKQKNRPRPFEREEDLILFEKIADDLDVAVNSDARLRQVAIQTALSKLEQHYRDVVILRFFEDKSYDEISDILHIPSGTVATYLSRAKAKLRDALKKSDINSV